MTPTQRERIDKLEDELGLQRGALPIRGESEGYVFTEVNGVTVLIAQKHRNERGGYKVAAVRTYDEVINPTNLDAARNARKLFDKQSSKNGKYGHLSPVVGLNWKCGNRYCRCDEEPYARRVARAIGYPVSVQEDASEKHGPK